ncbi:MAG: NADH-quinone oxidoreductase subunit J [Anaerolineales bacterium]|nr:NADH-quinone oxidoreductase subunit J [Anaerolineales bacterium]
MVPVLVFAAISLVTLGGAIAVVTNKNVLHSAYFLVLAFVGVASVYVLLEAPFIAVIQVLIYIGAIAILIIFAIMLTRRLMSKDMEERNQQWIWAALGALLLFGVLGWLVYNANWPVIEAAVPKEPITLMGEELLSTYVVPFEIASVLLLAALVGSILIGREKDQESRSAE